MGGGTVSGGDSTATVFEQNLAALGPVLDGQSYHLLATARPSEELEVIQSRSGLPTARFGGALLYSLHDPFREAVRLVEGQVEEGARVCLFYHFGLGYHPEAFLRAYPERIAVVVEPDIGLFLAALATRDLGELLGSDRLHLVLAADPDALPTILDSLHASRLSIVRLRGLAKRDEAYFERVDVVVQSYLSRREINTNTLSRFGRLWVRNLFRNLDVAAAARGVQELAGQFAGIPALLLAAGPSLDEVLPHLRSLAERALVVAVDTSLRASLRSGVVPDFAVVVDPQYWNSRHLDGCDRLDFDDDRRPILISESSTYPSVFRVLTGPLYLCASLFPLGMEFERLFGDRGKLGAGGSVSTTAWDFVRTLGCRPIYVAGLDLGFPDLRTHFAGGYFEERAHTLSSRLVPAEALGYHALHDGGPFPEDNNEGDPTLTDHRLIIYKWWFENQMKIHPDTQTFSLSRKGVRIEGMPLRPLSDLATRRPLRAEIRGSFERLLAHEPVASGAKPQRPAGQSSADARTPSSRLLDLLSGLASGLDEILIAASRAGSLLERVEKTLERGGNPATMLEELSAIDEALRASSLREIAGFLLQGTAGEILERQETPRQRADTPLADSKRLYHELRESAAYHLDLVRTAQGRVARPL